MVFDVITASGSVLDGPIIVVVDKQTGSARSFKDAFDEQRGRG
jgi:hypothetical protein